MLTTFKYRLYPTPAQTKRLEETLETCRRWYNTCLAERKESWEEKKVSIGKYDQCAHIKHLRKSNPYMAVVNNQVLQNVCKDLDKAFKAFFRRIKAGEKPGYPRFKGRNRFDSFGYPVIDNGVKIDGRRLRLQNIGRVRVRWHRPLEGKIKTVRIKQKAGKWYVCFACEVEPKPLPLTGRSVGVDVGISSLLTTSEGEKIENPKWYRASQAKLRVAQRRRDRRKRGGNNRKKANAIVQRLHEKISNQRKDYLNKIAHNLIQRYDVIVLEDLKIDNMVRNHHLSKSILDAGWGYLKLQLSHKAEYAGRNVVFVDPAYTSKTCSKCGFVFEGQKLSDRWIECRCGHSMDRDENAALNILKRAGHARSGITWANGPSVLEEASTL